MFCMLDFIVSIANVALRVLDKAAEKVKGFCMSAGCRMTPMLTYKTTPSPTDPSIELDSLFAKWLQAKFDAKTLSTKAAAFVHCLAELHVLLKRGYGRYTADISLMSDNGHNDLIELVARMLEKQKEFKSMKISTRIDLSFHYTTQSSLINIQKYGLLTPKDRSSRNIVASSNGSSFGEGIYFCDDHTTYRNQGFGPVCLLVARLKGTTSRWVSNAYTFQWGPLVVVRSSAQCVPLMHCTYDPKDQILEYRDKIQCLIDLMFNSQADANTVHRIWIGFPCLSSFVGQFFRPLPSKTIMYTAPDSLSLSVRDKILAVDLRSVINSGCVICLLPLQTQQVGQVSGCNHQFHYACILSAAAHSGRCPLCCANFAEPQGKMPSGSMKIVTNPWIACEGYSSTQSIVITYNIPSGAQKNYHPNPGRSFSGTRRVAYLPDDELGRKLLTRLAYAFTRGLTFTVGTSLTTGASDCVTWSSIHHKTSRCKGPHGYPDPCYMWNCNKELDVLGVPKAADLEIK
ncbi:E3 ubiquitin-protein ligase dtx3l [Mayamaea pseudoterrestris]|nr:E3 ubiquitin-protein ligase dtx3l [Mayamaea pseudoterrestris]